MSDTTMSSLSAYGAIVALVPAFLALGFTERGGNLLRIASWKARTTVRPSDGSCERILWSEIAAGPLHLCSLPAAGRCHQKPHVADPRCWEQTLWKVLNARNRGTGSFLEEKPKALPLGEGFIRADFKVVFAFLLMTDDMSLDIQTITPSLLVIHSKSTLKRIFTKEYVDRILDGYPPMINDPLGRTILKPGDERRGGWVAALGLEDNYKEEDVFMPYYYDCVQYVHKEYGDKRGHVFWRSMDRVHSIIVDVVAKAFVQDAAAKRDIDVAIKALIFMRTYETESGIEYFFDIPRPNQLPQPRDIARIVQLFNGPPLIAASKEASFRAEWSSLLPWVLTAAVIGSQRCIGYFKNPGREMEGILPMGTLKVANVYFRGCV